jgi:hypothetical protein
MLTCNIYIIIYYTVARTEIMTTAQSAVYVINHNTGIAYKHHVAEYKCDLLPLRMNITDLANLLVKMQKICFHDDNADDNNSERLIDLFTHKSDKTIAVILSLDRFADDTDYTTFQDGGSATMQLSNQKFLKYQQPWINEVCRAKLGDTSSSTSPVANVINMIDAYIKTELMKSKKTVDGVYLYIEKAPEHGSADFLLSYYAKYGYAKMAHEDNEYFYMYKAIHRETSPKSRTKKSVKRTTKPKSTSRKSKQPSPKTSISQSSSNSSKSK